MLHLQKLELEFLLYCYSEDFLSPALFQIKLIQKIYSINLQNLFAFLFPFLIYLFFRFPPYFFLFFLLIRFCVSLYFIRKNILYTLIMPPILIQTLIFKIYHCGCSSNDPKWSPVRMPFNPVPDSFHFVVFILD